MSPVLAACLQIEVCWHVTVFQAFFVCVRVAVVKKDNERLQKELHELKTERMEREKKPEAKEAPKRELKKDSRRIPGQKQNSALLGLLFCH